MTIKVDRAQAFILKMIRQATIFAVISFTCISSILLADTVSSMAGGFSQVPPGKLKELQTKLQNSNIESALGTQPGFHLKVLKIDSAEQQVVAGMNYNIKATISENGRPKTCCFFVNQGLPQQNGKTSFNIKCAQCGPQCDCRQEQAKH